MANAITVFVKEVIQLCSRVFINFLFFGANLPGGLSQTSFIGSLFLALPD